MPPVAEKGADPPSQSNCLCPEPSENFNQTAGARNLTLPETLIDATAYASKRMIVTLPAASSISNDSSIPWLVSSSTRFTAAIA